MERFAGNRRRASQIDSLSIEMDFLVALIRSAGAGLEIARAVHDSLNAAQVFMGRFS